MLIFLQFLDLAAIRMLLAGIPESIGVLVFGLGLIVVAVLIRRVLKRGEAAASDETK